MKEVLEVETFNFSAGKRFFSFDFTLKRNGKLIKKDCYASSDCRSASTIRKWLRAGWGTELVLERGF